MKLRSWAATVGPILVILGAALLGKGLSYFGSGPGSHPADGWFPVHVWGLVWVAAGAWCLVSSLWPRSTLARLALSAGVGLHLIWAGSFLAATLTGDSPRGWVSSVSYGSIVALTFIATWLSAKITALRAKNEALNRLVSAMPTPEEVADELRRD